MDSFTPAPPTCYFGFFFVYVWTILCVCLTSVWNLEKYETKKMTKALQRGQKQYVGEILIMLFKLPVLSCSQLLKNNRTQVNNLQCSSSRPV